MLLCPNLNDLLEKVDSRYTLVILSAKRARQINELLSSDYRMGLDALAPANEKLKSYKPLDIALKEIVEGKVTYKRLKDGIK
ncbi:DNA-directed RNA polymerase subunit omega [Candidatus Oleimmundimicrobium sp.]|uniref:DNA-directed RNA polymerase subunit omega n=1 Tax=Candidatus Oleimmundimicrobium sp. TaxID=3060597 RepID=UPI002721932B|nr:DNA-directed RNA polymerase subunit omega [Candidatus Oleimmundimicrobium sp.]MDO8885409.1 DNA-directed RNA polymerase subunit omega [Candidatus Oleimmundimicrobium sp.]